MRKSFIIFSTVIILAILALILFLPRQQASSIKVAYVEASSNLPFFVAVERGYFTENDIKIEMTKAANSSEALNLLAAGKVDVSIENNYNVIYALASKQTDLLKIVHPCYESREHPISHLLVKKNSSIKSISDLKGKRIGTFSGASQLLVLKLYIKNKLKLDPEKDFTLLQVEMNLQIPTLESGQFDALFTVEPYSTVALQKGTAVSIDDYVRGEIMDPFPAGGSSIRSDVIKNNLEAVTKFISALDKAIDDINKEGVKINSVLPKYTPLTKEIATNSQIYLFKKFVDTNKSDEQLVLDLMKLYTDSGILPISSLVKGLFLYQNDLE